MEMLSGVLTNSMMHEILESRELQFLCEKLRFQNEVSQRSTHHDKQLHIRKDWRSFSYFCPTMYKGFPESLRITWFSHSLSSSFSPDNPATATPEPED
ncbi:hypothetical protein J6590_106480 [Homalodisca vitripennis]|nr:hypothetical protein J6590_106480 [Homalodisca vitripennis]